MSEAITQPFGKLPIEWSYQPVVDNAEFLTGPAFDSTKFNTDGIGSRLVRGINLTKGTTRWSEDKTKYWAEVSSDLERYVLAEGDVLIGMDGSLVGQNYAHLKQSDLPALLVQRVARLRSKQTFDPSFLFNIFATDSWLTYVELVKTNSGIPHISNGDIKQFLIPFPPLPEQQKIAAILTSMDNVIESTQAQINKLQDLKTGMMQELLTKGIGHTEFKDSPVGRIPVGWESVYLKNIVKFSQGVQVDLELHSNEKIDGYVPFLRIENFTQQSKDIRYIPIKSANGKFISQGDVVLVRYGATAGFVSRGIEGVLANNLFVVAPNEKKLSKDLLYLHLLTSFSVFQKMMTGGAMPALNFKMVGDLMIPLPPVNEQKMICKSIISVELLIQSCRRKLVAIKNTKKALMKDLLTGKVRVKTDYDYVSG